MNSVAQSVAYASHLEHMTPEQFAAHAQAHFEENLLAFVHDAMAISGCKSLAAAGGGFLNVKANRRILDELQPDAFFVFPDAADSGNAAGAALMALQLEGALGAPLRLTMPYFGNDFGPDRIEASLRSSADLAVTRAGPDDIAKALTQGEVIGTFQGRMEAGPRALGNRSVLADPRHVSVKDRINGRLKGREPFVPFAPIVMEEEASRYWSGSTDYRYMTFAVECKQLRPRQSPGGSSCRRNHAPAGHERPRQWAAAFDAERVPRSYRGRCGAQHLLQPSRPADRRLAGRRTPSPPPRLGGQPVDRSVAGQSS